LKRSIFVLALMLAVLLTCLPCRAAGESALLQQAVSGMKAQLNMSEQQKLLADSTALPAGQSISDWLAIALCLSGADEGQESYRQALSQYVSQKLEQEGTLDAHKATEYHRIILALAALGADPTDVNGVDLMAEGTYNYKGDPAEQGTNGIIFALIAMDCLSVTVPQGSRYTRESILEALLALQNADGSFGLTAGTSDIDITAMAVQALAPYESLCSEQIGSALDWLSSMQTQNGGFVSYGAENAESVAQTVIALCALGLDPKTDVRFIKNGVSVYDALLTFRSENGMFRHTMEGRGDYLATAQTMLAIEAVQKGGRLYDMTALPAPVDSGRNYHMYLAGGAVLLMAALLIRVIRKAGRKQREKN